MTEFGILWDPNIRNINNNFVDKEENNIISNNDDQNKVITVEHCTRYPGYKSIFSI